MHSVPLAVMAAASMLFTLGSLVMGLAPNITILIMGRFIVGLAIGVAAIVSPVYLAGISICHRDARQHTHFLLSCMKRSAQHATEEP